MTALVPGSEIEAIVGVLRHRTEHWGRAVSAEQRVYILHSRECLDSGIDLRSCPYSLALDDGINEDDWTEDVAVPLAIEEPGRRLGVERYAGRDARDDMTTDDAGLFPTQAEVLADAWHHGRAWHGHEIEDACPCPQAPCGLVAFGPHTKGCPEHDLVNCKTIRQGHSPSDCPGAS